MSGTSVTVRLDIAADEMLRYYRGAAGQVVARAEDGRSVRFPASILRRYVTVDGVRGRFRIAFDERGRFRSIEPL